MRVLAGRIRPPWKEPEYKAIGRRAVMVLGVVSAAMVMAVLPVSADSFTSTNYKIDASAGNSFGGPSTSANYKLESSGGEAITGDGSSGSYRLSAGYISQLGQSIQLNVQPASLLVNYPMDEPAGNKLYDNTTGSADVSLVGNPVRTAGKIGQAISLDGSSQYASAGRQTLLDADPGEARTISLWFKAGVQTQQAYLIDQFGSCSGWEVSLKTNGTIELRFAADNSGCASPSTYTATTSGTRYDDNTWHHLTAVIDRPTGSMKVYVDAQEKASAASVNNSGPAASGNLVIGADGSSAGRFAGQIDEVKVYDHALTAKEVSHEYDAETAGIATALTFADIVPNSSQTVDAKAIVQTDAPGYELAITQDHDLQSGSSTIAAVPGDIANPAAWAEGSTKGLGFTLTGGPGLPGKWGTGPNYHYAAVPGGTSTMFSRSGHTGGAKDVITTQYRLDVSLSQPSGDYKNTVTYTATVLP